MLEKLNHITDIEDLYKNYIDEESIDPLDSMQISSKCRFVCVNDEWRIGCGDLT